MSNAYVRSRFFPDALSEYIAAHTSAPDEVQEKLRAVTQNEQSDHARMQIGDDQAVFMELLVQSIGARHAIEIGTFTGYSSIAIARGLGPSGRLLCCDVSDEWTSYARQAWKDSGLESRIELRLAPAIVTLGQLPTDDPFDFAFIDADKPGYLSYYEALLPLMRPKSLLLIDNTLQAGRVIDAANNGPNTVAIREFNDWVRRDERVTSVLLSIGDGITMVQKH